MIRHWLIRLLAGKDVVIVNAELPAGIELEPASGGRCMIAGNTFG